MGLDSSGTGRPLSGTIYACDEPARGWVCPLCGCGVAPWLWNCPCKSMPTWYWGGMMPTDYTCPKCGAWVPSGSYHLCGTPDISGDNP
jgi:hypothetical protein